jgi:hypothetical protein
MLLAAIMFEHPDYSLVQKLENNVPFGGKNTVFHSLANSYFGDKQPSDTKNVRSSILGTHFGI